MAAPPSQSDLRLGDVRRLSETAGGRADLARTIAEELTAAPPDAPVAVSYGRAQFTTEGYRFGWPCNWFQTSTNRPRTPEPPRPEGGGRCRRPADGGTEWCRVDPDGTEHTFTLNAAGLAASFAPAAVLWALPVGGGTLLSARRARRRLRQNLCFTCGYDVAGSAGSGQSAI